MGATMTTSRLSVLLLTGAMGCAATGSTSSDSATQNITAARPFSFAAGKERMTQQTSLSQDIGAVQQESVSLSNAFALAELSQFAYDDDATLKTSVAGIGLPTD